MSEQNFGDPSPVPWGVPNPNTPVSEPIEFVARGLIFATGGVLAGVLVTVVLWKMHIIAAIAAFALAAAAVALYTRGAGSGPRKGAVPLIALVLLGLVVAFLACVAVDLSDYYSANAPADAEPRLTFIANNLFDTGLLSSYGSDLAFYALFGVLGVFGTIRRLAGQRRA